MSQSPKGQEEHELTDEDCLRLAEAHDQEFGPILDQLTIQEAFGLHGQIADETHVSGYKTFELFRRALRKYGLTKVVTGFPNELHIEARKCGTTAETVWGKLGMPEELRQQSEVTTPTALRKLFELKKEHRRKLDRKRKADKSRPKEISKKNKRSVPGAQAENPTKKRKASLKKRKP